MKEYERLQKSYPGFTAQTSLQSIKASEFGRKEHVLTINEFDKDIFAQTIDLFCQLIQCPNTVVLKTTFTVNRDHFYKELDLSTKVIHALRPFCGVVKPDDLPNIEVELFSGVTCRADAIPEGSEQSIRAARWNHEEAPAEEAPAEEAPAEEHQGETKPPQAPPEPDPAEPDPPGGGEGEGSDEGSDKMIL